MDKKTNPLRQFSKSTAEMMAGSVKASRISGKSIFSQFVEMARLRRTPNCISPSEYYDFQLYDDRKFDWAAKRSFLGWRSPVFTDLQAVQWHALANDKLAYQGMMAGLGFNLPRIYAIYNKAGRYFGKVPVFGDAASLADFLRNACPYPFYGKPALGSYGEGNLLCTAHVPDSDSLRMASGELIKIDEFIKGLTGRSQRGFLLQQVLEASPMVAELWGNRLSTVRVVVALCDNGPRVLLGEWKIPTGTNIIDNFQHGSTGNLLAHLDPSSGRTVRVALPDGTVTSEHSITHPDTGVQLIGTAVPNWTAMVELAMTAARAFPGLRLQGWDIADTTSGLVPLEVNLVTGNAASHEQLLMEKGLFVEEVKQTWQASAKQSPSTTGP